MIPFKSYSQAAQDRFVYEVLVKPEGLVNGSFLDIGCCHPTELSNTYWLEQLGWRGLLVDNDPGAIVACIRARVGPAFQVDSTAVDWSKILDRFLMPRTIDYLSFDVDAATLDTLKALPLADYRFCVITIEHDSYRFGPNPRAKMREILDAHGYRLICGDVCGAGGEPFEDWWIDPRSVALERYERFACSGKRWTEIFVN